MTEDNKEVLIEKVISGSIAPIEINDPNIPSDIDVEWARGYIFWMIKISEDGLDRYSGVLVDGWIRCHIDLDKKRKYAYIGGENKVKSAKAFVNAYGGKMFFEGKPLEV